MTSQSDILDLDSSDLTNRGSQVKRPRWVELLILPGLWLLAFAATARALGL